METNASSGTDAITNFLNGCLISLPHQPLHFQPVAGWHCGGVRPDQRHAVDFLSTMLKRLSLLAWIGCSGGLFFGSVVFVGAQEARPLMRDFIGLNGHTIAFKPELYRPVCGWVRDYHPVEWDLGKDSAELPGFPFAKNGVDWSRVYGSWRTNGWHTDVCLQFEALKQADWVNIEADAWAYGKAFAHGFGPSGKRKLVEAVEIGNEPGKWNDADYTRMFKAMAQGIRAGDPKLKIATCNLTTGKSGDYEKSVDCVANCPELFDVLNVHSYAQLEGWPTWRRSFPEDPKLPHYLQDVAELCQWRDAHAPGKPVWLGESGNAQCGGEPGVSDVFAGGFWWLDELGRMARHGEPFVVRQTLSGSSYGLIDDATLTPRPDYWTSVLWRRLMGTKVLAVTPSSDPLLLMYAHCTRAGASGSITLAVENLDRQTAVSIPLDTLAGEADVYELSSPDVGSAEIDLNGVALQANDDGAPPPLNPRILTHADTVVFGPATYGFVVLPGAGAPACL